MKAAGKATESARTMGVAALFGAAWLALMVVAYSTDAGGLLPLSDAALALELPEHCDATRTLSGYTISCDVTKSGALTEQLGARSDAVLSSVAAQVETALQLTDGLRDVRTEVSQLDPSAATAAR